RNLVLGSFRAMTKAENISDYRQKIKKLMAAAEALGPAAYEVALQLLDTDKPFADIYTAIRHAPSGGAMHRGRSFRAAMTLEPAPDALSHQIASIARAASHSRVINGKTLFRNDEIDAG